MNARSSASSLWPVDQYELIDFGVGRKLERFGQVVLDRPCPAAENWPMVSQSEWRQAQLRLSDRSLASEKSNDLPCDEADWQVSFGGVRFQLRLTPFGHVGLFPEHAEQWNWLVQRSHSIASRHSNSPPTLLNLFAYTGGATLVLAGHGWHVTHVDASEPTVQWARLNANLSDLQSAPVRWLVEDARVYVARELKRGRSYDAILLDPPSYGHGPHGKAWQLERDLPSLFEQCCQLLNPKGAIVLTGHSEQLPITASEVKHLLQSLGRREVTVDSSRVTLADRQARPLDFGWCIRSYGS